MASPLPTSSWFDDNDTDVFLIEHALKQHNVQYKPTRLADGEAAIDAFLSGRLQTPDLFLLDLNLPRRHGRGVLKAVREHPVLADIPVAVFTSSFARDDREEAASLGASRFVQKPGGLDDFFEAVVGVVLDLVPYVGHSRKNASGE